jgi:hypothetical protein
VLCRNLFHFFNNQIEKEEQAAAEKAVTKEEFQGEWTAPAPEFTATQPEVADWSEGVQVPSVPIQQFPTGMYGFEFLFYSSFKFLWKSY